MFAPTSLMPSRTQTHDAVLTALKSAQEAKKPSKTALWTPRFLASLSTPNVNKTQQVLLPVLGSRKAENFFL